MWSKIKTAIRHRSTEKSKVPLQAFVESGTPQDFKRCVLDHIGYCRTLSIAFWGTYTPGMEYGEQAVVLNGTNTWIQADAITRPNETQDFQTFCATGTVAGNWFEERVQGGGHGIIDSTCASNLDDYRDPEVRAEGREEAVYSSP